VIDGDTIRYGGAKIRLEDIDTPETHEPRCASEAALGRRDAPAPGAGQRRAIPAGPHRRTR
jgi:endonuclease YncB( thermonuclease family)